MEWWLWCSLGAILVSIEMVVPGTLAFLFLGIGAFIVGFVVLAGIPIEPWFQFMLFGMMSIAALVLLVRRLKHVTAKSAGINEITGEIGVAQALIAPNTNGQVELRGAVWNAKNVGAMPIVAGQRCKVESVVGLVLMVVGE
jgi:membrane protein implicated in regulation of membrane protease activity